MTEETVFTDTYELLVPPPDIDHQDLGPVEKWRRRGDLWEGLVTREVDGEVVTEWVPALSLAPTQ